MTNYLELSQDLSLPEHKRYEYLAAIHLNMLMWDDIKDIFCKKFGAPNTNDHGIDLVSADFKKIAQVKCFDATKISWKSISTFLAYQSKVRCDEVILVTTPGTTISKMVLWAISDIVFVSKSGIVKDRYHYIEEINEIISSKKTSELPSFLRSIKQIENKTKSVQENKLATKSPKDEMNIEKIKTWITQNPPGTLNKTEYHKKYKASGNVSLAKNKLSTIMMSMGYKTNHTQPRSWNL